MTEKDFILNGDWKRLDSLYTKLSRLRVALRALYDEQNGPPLYNREMQWKKAMQLSKRALND